jgi:hypothetical protein
MNQLIKPVCAIVGALVLSAATAQPAPSAPGPSGAPARSASQSFDETAAAQLVQQMAPPLPADAPKPSPDPHDLEGTWFHAEPLLARITQDMFGENLPYTPKGQRILNRRIKATYQDGIPYINASAECLPPGQQWQLDLNMPFQIYQSPREIDFVFEEYHGVWKIRMNQPHRPASAPREYMGDSVGRWDGSTLVVDTVNYKQGLWLDVDGTPTSRDVHIVHRIRKVDYGGARLEVLTTVDDPQMYSAPWAIARSYSWRPDMASFKEYDCESQVGVPGAAERYGLVPEPSDAEEGTPGAKP